MEFQGEISLTYKDGVFRPDAPVAMPDGTRVRATLRSVTPDPDKAARALEKIKQIRASGLYRSGGRKFTRDDMHERD
jgi:predicted DNA-binding antitoxin AbrB/MazE fold protein